MKQDAGRELDARVAEKVMGFRWFVPGDPKWKGPTLRILWLDPWMSSFAPWDGNEAVERFDDWDREVPRYSENIEAAFQVVEKMRERGMWLKLTSPFEPGDVWNAGFTEQGFTGWNGRPDHRAQGDTAALAICLAALAAIEATEKESTPSIRTARPPAGGRASKAAEGSEANGGGEE